jgi:hypothetical protein
VAGKKVSFTIPHWTANLLPNLLGLAGLVGMCVMLAFLADWRWGGMLGSVFAVGLAVWIQWSAAPESVEVAPDNVAPLKKAS